MELQCLNVNVWGVLLDRQSCLCCWVVSSGIHTNARTQGVPAEYWVGSRLIILTVSGLKVGADQRNRWRTWELSKSKVRLDFAKVSSCSIFQNSCPSKLLHRMYSGLISGEWEEVKTCQTSLFMPIGHTYKLSDDCAVFMCKVPMTIRLMVSDRLGFSGSRIQVLLSISSMMSQNLVRDSKTSRNCLYRWSRVV